MPSKYGFDSHDDEERRRQDAELQKRLDEAMQSVLLASVGGHIDSVVRSILEDYANAKGKGIVIQREDGVVTNGSGFKQEYIGWLVSIGDAIKFRLRFLAINGRYGSFQMDEREGLSSEDTWRICRVIKRETRYSISFWSSGWSGSPRYGMAGQLIPFSGSGSPSQWVNVHDKE